MKAALFGVFKGKGNNGKSKHKISDFPSDPVLSQKSMSANGDLSTMSTVGENFSKKSATLLNKLNSSSSSMMTTSAFSSSAEKLTSSSSSTSQIVKSTATASSTSSSLVSKKSQILHSVSSQELKQQQHENRNFSRSVSVTSSSSSSSSTDSRMKMLSSTQRAFSAENVLAEESEPNELVPQEVKFEQKKIASASKMKVTADGFSTAKMAASKEELRRVQTGDMSYEEKHAAAAMKEKVEGNGFSSEKIAALRQDQKQLRTGDTVQQQQRMAMASAMKMSTEDFTAEKIAMAKQEELHVMSKGVVQQEKNVSSSSSARITITSKGITKSSMSSQCLHQAEFGSLSSSSVGMSSSLSCPGLDPFELPASHRLAIAQGLEEDLQILSSPAPQPEIEKAMNRFGGRMATCVEKLKIAPAEEATALLMTMNDMIRKAWAVPTFGHDLGFNMCNILRNSGGLDILIQNCTSDNAELQFSSAQLLEQCLSTENRAYVADNGLEQVVKVACACSMQNSLIHSRVGTGILENMFKHSEATCSDVIRMGGLKAILYDCRTCDLETLRHCAAALANLSLYGGSENQQAMIKHKVPVWLFPLAFNNDDNIKYYACLAITALVANKEIEAAVLRSGTLDLVDPFVMSHNPEEFANSTVAHVHGQSKNWLLRLVPVLNSKREEARSLAAFHFAMEAGIKKKQGNTIIFHEIGAIEVLKKVASSPNAIASKYAAQALQLIGEEVPHKLSQQVPLWTVEDVREWVKQIGFSQYCQEFTNGRVDGDLLLQLTECMLKDDIGIKNGILRKRFLRELNQLKRMADYTSCDSTNLNQILHSLGPEFCQYTYGMLHSGVQRDTLKYLTEEQLAIDCGMDNSIHRLRVAQAIRGFAQQSENGEEEDVCNKSLDVFISYRRSNGSQLASLLKVHLQLKGFSVFIDVERLEAGKFDNNLLNSIRQAKHFLLVLTPNALDRCINDNECKDWVHKEIVEALQSQCNIIPILDNFQWPEAETLPEDMRAVCYFNGVRWIHDYQDACVDKLERFMRGEMNVRSDGPLGRYVGMGGPGTPGTPSTTLSRLPHYHRSASNDSAKGSTCSDKEINGNGRSLDGSH